jgi:DNA repair protein RecN (Recombination protein N)
MLGTLAIRDVVLIEVLDLEFRPGFTALTGETGAGKSILLDALGLALGLRAEARLVRAGAAQASVAAEFRVAPDHPAFALLAEHGLAPGDEAGTLILRRVLGADGRSRAFVNDQPTGVGLLRQIGETLVEIHGQFESQRLIDAASHRALLDAFAGLAPDLARTAAAWHAWREAEAQARAAAEGLDKARREEDFLRHAVEELSRLGPKPGEEAELASARARQQHAGRVGEALRGAGADLDAGKGVEGALASAHRQLERIAGLAGGKLDAAIAALARASAEAAEARAQLERAGAGIELDPQALEAAEERLFALRANARKHSVEVDRLPEVLRKLQTDLAAIEDGGETTKKLARLANERRAAFIAAARALTAKRRQGADALGRAVTAEMAPLKLGKAGFRARIEEAAESDWGPTGCDRVLFEAETNPGQPPGPLNKIASGGELARFMLALKAVLAGADPVPVLIFDEVDAGVGGAVAAAVGERLAGLAREAQVLVVTHSPQVAARGDAHIRVAKRAAKGATTTSAEPLGEAERIEEIARMLAGARITDEARAAALSLLKGGRDDRADRAAAKPRKAKAAP